MHYVKIHWALATRRSFCSDGSWTNFSRMTLCCCQSLALVQDHIKQPFNILLNIRSQSPGKSPPYSSVAFSSESTDASLVHEVLTAFCWWFSERVQTIIWVSQYLMREFRSMLAVACSTSTSRCFKHVLRVGLHERERGENHKCIISREKLMKL